MADGCWDWAWEADSWWQSQSWSEDAWTGAGKRGEKTAEPVAGNEAPAVPPGPPPSPSGELNPQKGGAGSAGEPASSSRPWPCNPGTSKWSEWLSNQEFETVFHHPRGEPEKKPMGKKHDFNQLQRVCAYRVRQAQEEKAELDEAYKELQAQKLATDVEIAELWTQKTEAEAKASSAEGKCRESQALVTQLTILLDMKNSLVNNVAQLNGIAQNQLQTLGEENMALGFQLEVLDDEIEGLEEKCDHLQKQVDELTKDKAELMATVGTLQTSQTALQEKLNKVKQGLRTYRARLERAALETKLFEDWLFP
eukprot:s2714_g12.t1